MQMISPTRPPPRRPQLLAVVLVLAGCGGAVSDPADASSDAAPVTDARTDGGPDAVVARDAGDVPHYDAGLPACEVPGFFSPYAARFSFFNLSSRGWPNEGLDLDNNSSTCAPQGNCFGGVDNQLAVLQVEDCGFETLNVSSFNYLLRSILEEGSAPASWLIEARDLTVVGGNNSAAPFRLMLHTGHWFPSATCDQATDVLNTNLRCDYLTDDDMFAPGSCDSLSEVSNAEIIDGKLVAGSPSTTLWIVYTVFGLTAGIVLHNARMEADVDVVGDQVTVTNGILAGVMCPAELMLMLGSVMNVNPADCDMANKIPSPDLEVGCSADDPDGISVGFTFEAHSANIVGLLRD